MLKCRRQHPGRKIGSFLAAATGLSSPRGRKYDPQGNEESKGRQHVVEATAWPEPPTLLLFGSRHFRPLVQGLVVRSVAGVAVGFRIHGSVTDALAAFALLVAFGFAIEWLFITLLFHEAGARGVEAACKT